MLDAASTADAKGITAIVEKQPLNPHVKGMPFKHSDFFPVDVLILWDGLPSGSACRTSPNSRSTYSDLAFATNAL